MTVSPTCKPWCTDHQDPNECLTRILIYDKGKDETEESEPAPGSLAAQFQAFGGWPAEISWITFVASQDDEDEYPVMDLQFFEGGGKDQNSNLHVDVAAL